MSYSSGTTSWKWDAEFTPGDGCWKDRRLKIDDNIAENANRTLAIGRTGSSPATNPAGPHSL
jgi:hypothetical protein